MKTSIQRGIKKRRREKWSATLKNEVVRRIMKNGEGINDVASEYKIPRSTLTGWLKKNDDSRGGLEDSMEKTDDSRLARSEDESPQVSSSLSIASSTLLNSEERVSEEPHRPAHGDENCLEPHRPAHGDENCLASWRAEEYKTINKIQLAWSKVNETFENSLNLISRVREGRDLLFQEVENLKKVLNAKTESETLHIENNKELKREKESLQRQVDKLTSSLTLQREERDQLLQEIEKLKQHQKESERLQIENNKELERKNNSLRQQVDNWTSSLTSLQSELEDKNAQILQLEVKAEADKKLARERAENNMRIVMAGNIERETILKTKNDKLIKEMEEYKNKIKASEENELKCLETLEKLKAELALEQQQTKELKLMKSTYHENSDPTKEKQQLIDILEGNEQMAEEINSECISSSTTGDRLEKVEAPALTQKRVPRKKKSPSWWPETIGRVKRKKCNYALEQYQSKNEKQGHVAKLANNNTNTNHNLAHTITAHENNSSNSNYHSTSETPFGDHSIHLSNTNVQYSSETPAFELNIQQHAPTLANQTNNVVGPQQSQIPTSRDVVHLIQPCAIPLVRVKLPENVSSRIN